MSSETSGSGTVNAGVDSTGPRCNEPGYEVWTGADGIGAIGAAIGGAGGITGAVGITGVTGGGGGGTGPGCD